MTFCRRMCVRMLATAPVLPSRNTRGLHSSHPPPQACESRRCSPTSIESSLRSPTQSQAAMGKVPVRLKEVVYTLSPYHQQVMAGLWKDIPYKLSKKFHENWVSAFTLVIPIVGTYMYAENFKEQEKLHHRY